MLGRAARARFVRDAEFAAFYRTMVGPLSRYSTRLSRHRADGEDVASETLTQMYHRWNTIPPRKRSAMAYVIARRRTIDALRRSTTQDAAIQLMSNSTASADVPDLGSRLEVRDRANDRTYFVTDADLAKYLQPGLTDLPG